jgi:hypothetical protein
VISDNLLFFKIPGFQPGFQLPAFAGTSLAGMTALFPHCDTVAYERGREEISGFCCWFWLCRTAKIENMENKIGRTLGQLISPLGKDILPCRIFPAPVGIRG